MKNWLKIVLVVFSLGHVVISYAEKKTPPPTVDNNEEQKRLAEASKKHIEQSGRLTQPIVTEIVQAGEFYPAEEYHQDYCQKNPVRYKLYRSNCGRDQVLERIWGESQ